VESVLDSEDCCRIRPNGVDREAEAGLSVTSQHRPGGASAADTKRRLSASRRRSRRKIIIGIDCHIWFFDSCRRWVVSSRCSGLGHTYIFPRGSCSVHLPRAMGTECRLRTKSSTDRTWASDCTLPTRPDAPCFLSHSSRSTTTWYLKAQG
jgi:hypothetical protein